MSTEPRQSRGRVEKYIGPMFSFDPSLPDCVAEWEAMHSAELRPLWGHGVAGPAHVKRVAACVVTR
jgi:hypothetical protein